MRRRKLMRMRERRCRRRRSPRAGQTGSRRCGPLRMSKQHGSCASEISICHMTEKRPLGCRGLKDSLQVLQKLS